MLDPDGRNHILQLMGELHDTGITVIHITHQATEAFRADRIIVIHQGKVMLDQSRDELYANAAQLDQWGLDVPIGIQLHQALQDKGWKLSDKVESEEQLVSELWTFM
jgi:energy-coupling factor transport system ATP-binding protein